MKSLVNCLSAVFFLTLSVSGFAQETEYLDSSLNTTKKRHATYVRELTPISENTYAARVTSADGTLKCEGVYVFMEEKLMEHGTFVFYYPNGKIESKGEYEYGVKVGTWERYTTGGQRKADRYYDPKSANLIRSVMTE